MGANLKGQVELFKYLFQVNCYKFFPNQLILVFDSHKKFDRSQLRKYLVSRLLGVNFQLIGF